MARLPGGVFAVVGKGAGRDRAQGLWARLMALVAHPASCEGHGVDVRFTVRLAQCEPVDDAAGDLRMLLRHAEEALSQAKQQRLCGPEPDVIDGFEALVR